MLAFELKKKKTLMGTYGRFNITIHTSGPIADALWQHRYSA